jgi:copper resistance protein D
MRSLYLVSVWLHILSAMTWVGGMVVFVLALMPFLRQQSGAMRSALLEDFGRRFRNVEFLCFAVLVVALAIVAVAVGLVRT